MKFPNFAKFDQDTRYSRARRIPFVIKEISCRCLIPGDTVSLWFRTRLTVPPYSSANPARPFSLLTSLFPSPSFRSLRLLSDVPNNEVCVSLDKLYCSWLVGWFASSLSTYYGGKSNSGEIRRANRFSTPEMLSPCTIDSSKKPSLLLVFFFVVFCFIRAYGDRDSGISSK